MNGYVLVWLMVEEDGTPKDVHVARSLGEGLNPDLKQAAAGLDKSAVKTVERYRFQPAMFQGKAVPVQIQVKCQFRSK